MKKLFFTVGFFGMLAGTACNGNEESESEVIVKDSMGVTTGAPLTDHIDSAAADTSTALAEPVTQENTPAPPGVKTDKLDYSGNGGENISATYNSNDQMALVTLEVSGENPIKLMQISASGNNAEYSNGSINWKKEGDAATLTKDGKTTKFVLKK